jgi:hypothetical protein
MKTQTKGESAMTLKNVTLKNVTLNGKPLQFCSLCGRQKAPGLCPCLVPPPPPKRRKQ